MHLKSSQKSNRGLFAKKKKKRKNKPDKTS